MFLLTKIPKYFKLKTKEFPQLPRHFQKFINCLGISGNAGFPQLPATYTLGKVTMAELGKEMVDVKVRLGKFNFKY